MPQFLITAPNGKKYRITGDSPEGAMQALQQHLGGSAPAEEQPTSGAPAAPVDMASVYADEMLFGLPGKAAAGVGALIRAPFTDKSIGEEYSGLRDAYQNAREQYAEEHPARNLTAELAGGIAGAGKFLKGGKLAAEAVAAPVVRKLEGNLLGRAAGEAAGGAAIGGLSGYGHDESIAGGAALGGVLGGAARPVVEGATGAANAIGGMLGVGNAGRAKQAIYEALTRSGKSMDEVQADMASAVTDGQPEYMLADALGNSGQRMLSGVARTPGDMRQVIADTLMKRQAGQGERLSNALAEGFNAPDTAAQRAASLRAEREMLADVNYENAGRTAKAVDLNGAIRAADSILQPGVNKITSPSSKLAQDSTDALLSKYRARMTNGREMLSDFNEVLKLKSDITDEIQTLKNAGQNKKAGALGLIAKQLDGALEKASSDYRAANDAFRAQSRTVDAVDLGKQAASGRARSADTVQRFEAMQPGERNAFRAGYVDPLIARVEASSISPTTNKARSLITSKTGEEFPAFAVPQRADRMGRRIARENRMFQTANAALGGSKTADNMADIGEMASFDPSIIGSLATGNIKGAIVQSLTKGAQALNGRNQQTRDMIAKMLLQGSPTKAKADLAQAIEAGERLTEKQAAVVRLLIGATVPRVAAAGLN